MKHASKSMIGAMLSGPTGTSTRIEEEAECTEAACCCMHGVAYYFYATICLVRRGLDLSTVRAQPCKVVEGSMKPSKTCKVFEGLVRDALRFLTEEIQS